MLLHLILTETKYKSMNISRINDDWNILIQIKLMILKKVINKANFSIYLLNKISNFNYEKTYKLYQMQIHDQ